MTFYLTDLRNRFQLLFFWFLFCLFFATYGGRVTTGTTTGPKKELLLEHENIKKLKPTL